VHCAITSFGFDTMNNGAPITGSRSGAKIEGNRCLRLEMGAFNGSP
jgi:hypothetical protein